MDIIAVCKRTIRDYYVAATTEEALAYLTAHHGQAQLVAGGTTLMPQMQRHEAVATHLVDIARVGTMLSVIAEDSDLLVGGAVTFKMLLKSDCVRQNAPLLYAAAQLVGTPKLRKLATLAGNIVAAGGSAEGAVALVALNAKVEVTNFTGAQWLPVESLFVRCGVSRIDSMSEIVTTIRLPRLAPGQGVAIGRISGRGVEQRAPFSLALVLTLAADGATITGSSVAVGSLTTPPHRLQEIEHVLAGQPVAVSDTREGFATAISTWAQTEGLVANDTPGVAEQVGPLASLAFDHAIGMAGQRVNAPVPDA